MCLKLIKLDDKLTLKISEFSIFRKEDSNKNPQSKNSFILDQYS